MDVKKISRVLRIILANVAITLALLTVTELIARHLEQAMIAHHRPSQWSKLPPKAIPELRVFAFGGSTVYGVPVPALGFVAQTDYWLQHLYPDHDVRLYNFGWPGMDTCSVLQELTRRLDDQPDLILVMTGHNEFLGASTEAGLTTSLSRFATVRILRRGVARITKSKKEYVMPCQVSSWDRESASFKSRTATFERCMNLIVERTRRKGVKLIVGTLPSNLSDWPPVYKHLAGRDQWYQRAVSDIQGLLGDRKYREALEAATEGLNVYREDAMLYFLLGKTQSALGQYARARESFVKARDLDPIPWRTSSQLNSIIRRAASGISGVYLIDLERIYGEHSENGLVGLGLIGDNVHATPLGDSITAQALMETMVSIGSLPSSPIAKGECCPASAFCYEETKAMIRCLPLSP